MDNNTCKILLLTIFLFVFIAIKSCYSMEYEIKLENIHKVYQGSKFMAMEERLIFIQNFKNSIGSVMVIVLVKSRISRSSKHN